MQRRPIGWMQSRIMETMATEMGRQMCRPRKAVSLIRNHRWLNLWLISIRRARKWLAIKAIMLCKAINAIAYRNIHGWRRRKRRGKAINHKVGLRNQYFFQLTNFQVFPFKMHFTSEIDETKIEKINSQKLLESKIHLRILNKINRQHKISRN